MLRRRFLDRKVEASLKPLGARGLRAVGPGFLDRKVEASLKPGSRSPSAPAGSDRFLDRKVEASLKLYGDDPRSARGAGFLDRKVEASLKRAYARMAAEERRGFLDRKVEASLKLRHRLRNLLRIVDSSTERSRPH